MSSEDAPRPGSQAAPENAINRGFGRVLIGLYALFALAAGARSAVQIISRFSEAPVAYLLSALAAVIYATALVGLIRGDSAGWWLAVVCCSIELIGVLAVGSASLLVPQEFPRASVWSAFGSGYGFVPLVLPVLGLIWLGRTRPGGHRPSG